MVNGRTVRLYLVDGHPTGIITAEIMNWTGHVLLAPRSRLVDALSRPEAARTGIYILSGEDPEDPTRIRIYVGEGDSVVERIKSHAKDASKDFWTHAFIITSKDANLTKAHVRYLESRLIERAKSAGRASVANGNEPASKQLPESDTADMEFFLTQIEVVLPVIGLDVLRTKPTKSGPIAPEGDPELAGVLELFLKNKKHNISAAALEADGEVTVLAGSQAVMKEDFAQNSYQGLRQSLIRAGHIALAPDGEHFVFTRDVSFPSPSAAAAVVLNRNSNGRVEWRVGSGQTLRDWQDAQLASVPAGAVSDSI